MGKKLGMTGLFTPEGDTLFHYRDILRHGLPKLNPDTDTFIAFETSEHLQDDLEKLCIQECEQAGITSFEVVKVNDLAGRQRVQILEIRKETDNG